MKEHNIRRVAVIGNYLPRKCGIATFTADLVAALSKNDPDVAFRAIAMNDIRSGYRYPEKVRFEIDENHPKGYQAAADFINASDFDVVSLQHEYGIFGGEYGHYLLLLMKNLKIPVITTLHTVLQKPNKLQHKVLDNICDLSAGVVVMSEKAVEIIRNLYGIPEEKIHLIYHGIPNIPFSDSKNFKIPLVAEEKKILLTFGLLSPNKGIEFVIDALPKIVEKHPEVVYVLVGATHPSILRTSGDEYRRMLEVRAERLNVEGHVKFINQFVELEELKNFIGATDIYITPYLSEAQIVSGTLSMAMGAGKAIISTPYWYASEMLAEDRGILVDFKNSEQIADNVISLLDNPEKQQQISRNAHEFSRKAIWSEVAKQYFSVFGKAKQLPVKQKSGLLEYEQLIAENASPPDINLDHLETLTDDTGILQHATYSIPNFNHGYCIDDNARALIVAVIAEKFMSKSRKSIRLQKKYLAFIMHAFNEENQRFRNFMSFDRKWLEEKGSEDSQGRTIWGLGVCCSLSGNPDCVTLSTNLFQKSIEVLQDLKNPRSMAHALVGMNAYLTKFSGDRKVRVARDRLAESLFQFFHQLSNDNWPWFEDILTYDNAKISQSLILSGHCIQREDMKQTGLKILDWLIDIQTENDHFSPIGCDGWFQRNGEKTRYDQQPIEASSMIEACLLAHHLTGDPKYKKSAEMIFNWYMGINDAGLPLYDFSTGGCKDGLVPGGVNENQGAESTLSWLLSLLYMHEYNFNNVSPSKMLFTVPQDD